MEQLNPALFLRHLAQEIASVLPQELQGIQAEPRGRLLKLWYGGEKQIHYEIALHEFTQRIEIGLHCEATPEQNELVRRELAAELFEIKHRLGQRVEVEPWDRGWSRVYEIHPFQPLDEVRARELANRCATFIGAIQPMYEEIAFSTAGQQIRLSKLCTKRD